MSVPRQQSRSSRGDRESLQACHGAALLEPAGGEVGEVRKSGRYLWLSVIQHAIPVALMLALVALLLKHTVNTNDGPVHVAFAHVLLTWGQAGNPLQHAAYVLHLRANPNVAVYLLMVVFMRVFSPEMTESIVQALSVVGPVFMAWFALRMANKENDWLAIFLIPLSLNQMFFLGLYSFCSSIAAFFLTIGIFFWLQKAPSWRRAGALGGSLIAAYFCHAGGFVMAWMGVASLSGVLVLLDWRRFGQLLKALRGQRHALCALLAPFPVGAFFLASADKTATEYLVPLKDRLKQIGTMHLLSVNYPMRDRYVALALCVCLVAVFVIVTVRIVRGHARLRRNQRDLALAAVGATVVSVAIALAFPDLAGGGWTHFRRFELFPYYWVLVVLAFDRYPRRIAALLLTAGTLASVMLMYSMVMRQATVREQMTPLAEADGLIGNHCTVLPVVLERRPEEWTKLPAWTDFEPYYQSASRLELHGDRVVLFNYLARLAPYPVHFKPEVEPQSQLFRWKPLQYKTAITQIDIPHFESVSGLPVDYILQWGRVEAKPLLAPEIKKAISNYQAVYHSEDGRVVLYHHNGPYNTMCVAPGAPAH